MSKLTEKQKTVAGITGICLLAVFTILTTIPNGPDWFGRETKLHLGLDLQGGTSLTYQADTSSIKEEDKQSAIEGVKDVIEKRVNTFGVSEPVVRTSKVGNDYRVNIELPGVTDTAKAIQMIGETPLLEFKTYNKDVSETLTDEQKATIESYNKEAKSKAESLRDEIKNGADFDEIAKLNSEDSTTKDVGGDMGFISEDSYHSELFKEASTMQDGWFSWNVIETSEGYNLIKRVSERVGEKQLNASHLLICYKGATGCEKETSKEEALSKIQSLRSEILKASDIEKAFTESVKANSTEPNASETGGELGWFGKGELVPAFENVVFSMNNKEVSDVVETEFGYHLIYRKADRNPKEINVKRILIKKMTELDFLTENMWINTELSGKYLERSSVSFNQTTGAPEVTLSFDSTGTKLFAEITEANIGNYVAIFLDGEPITTPIVNSVITGGQAIISGDFTVAEAKELSTRLNSGALPVSIKLLNQQRVEPTLGKVSLRKSFIALAVGFILVAVFMILMYRLPGLVSVIALGIYAALNITIFKLFNYTITLSGIAGLVLSIGMAVDANVLIFERSKEEIKNGSDLTVAFKTGFKRAWSSIKDGNITTLIICFVLYIMSSSSVKGFGLTLGIGVLASMFTAVVVTRTILIALTKTKLSKFNFIWNKKAVKNETK